MRAKAVLIVAALSAALLTFGATESSKARKTTAKKVSRKSTKSRAKKRAPAKRSSSKKKFTASRTKRKSTAKSASSRRRSTRRTARRRRSIQQQPTAERYQQIQQALADYGYYHGAVDGMWGADSVEALKRFQHDQNLDEDGKIGSLSLIALGLGPKREASAKVKPPDAKEPGPTPEQ